MNSPHYLRHQYSSNDELPSNNYKESLSTSSDHSDQGLLHITGLRRKKLVILIVCLAILSILAIVLFIVSYHLTNYLCKFR